MLDFEDTLLKVEDIQLVLDKFALSSQQVVLDLFSITVLPCADSIFVVATDSCFGDS